MKSLEGRKQAETEKKAAADQGRKREMDNARAILGRAGQGPEWRRFDAAFNAATAEERRLTAEIESKKPNLTRLQREVKDRQEEIKRAEAAIAKAAALQDPTPLVQGPNGTADYGKSMKDLLVAFQLDPSPTGYANIAGLCGRIQTAITAGIPAASQSAGLAQAVAASCNLSELDAAPIKARSDKVSETETPGGQTRIAYFRTVCSADAIGRALERPVAAQTPGTGDAGPSRLARARDAVVQCVKTAPLLTSMKRDEEQQRINAFMETYDLGGDQLKTAVNVFTRDPLHAMISIIFALFQDMFVLVAGIGAEYAKSRNEEMRGAPEDVDMTIHETDLPMVKARKALLAAAKPAGNFYLVDLGSPEWKERTQAYEENLNYVLGELASRKLASGSGRTFRIERRGYQEIARAVAEAVRKAAAEEDDGAGGRRWKPRTEGTVEPLQQRPGFRRDLLSEWVGSKNPPDGGYKQRRS
jgi:hypothetical protein